MCSGSSGSREQIQAEESGSNLAPTTSGNLLIGKSKTESRGLQEGLELTGHVLSWYFQRCMESPAGSLHWIAPHQSCDCRLSIQAKHITGENWCTRRDCVTNFSHPPPSGPEKGVIAKGVFSLEESPESLNSLESLENGRILLYFPLTGGSLKFPESQNSLENRLF